MRKFFLMIATVLTVMVASAQGTVTVVENLADYTGNDAYVYNQADGKVYVLNNLNEYERYGVYQKTNTLKVAGGGDTDIDYIATTSDMSSVPYINTGYVHKSNTRIEAEVNITDHTRGWEAVFGARQNGFGDHAFVLFSRAFDTRNTGVFNRSGKEEGFNADIPLNQKIVIKAGGLQADVYSADDLSTPIASCTSTGNNDDGTNAMFIFDTNTGGANEARPDNSSSKKQLYSFKIYEDETLVMDLQPIVTATGEAGLRDKVSGQKFFSAREGVAFAMSPDGEFAASNAGITVYEGKMVINTTDGKVYKYTDNAFVEVGTPTLEAIAGTDYQNMKNWRSNDEHWNNVYGNGENISYDETTNTNSLDPYVGTGGWEPLFYTLDVEEDTDYNVSFTFSSSSWNSWNDGAYATLPFKVLDRSEFDHGNGNYDDAGLLASIRLPKSANDNLEVNTDFSSSTGKAHMIVQFGVVNDGNNGFWFKFNNLLVQKYVYPEAYPVVNPYGARLAVLIPEVENAELNTTEALANALEEALNAAKAVADGDDLAAQKAAVEKLEAAFNAAKSVDVTLLKQIMELAKADGADVTAGEDFLVNGTEGLGDCENKMRVARKVANIEQDEAAYKGNEPAEGAFYLYNVGRKAYLTSGSDWGTHAALGYPGLEATLAANGDGFSIQFNELIQGQARDKFLGGSPYVDCADGDKGTYVFEPVSGKEGVYAIKGNRGYLAFDPEGEVDGGGIHHFNTVTATWGTPGNSDAEWMLVTKADRLAQMENATDEAPVDVTVIVRDASFNKFAALDNPWTDLNQGWEWGNRDFGDKNTETFNSQEYNLRQIVTFPKAGEYEVSVQSYYRDGNIDPHVESVANGEELHAPAMLYVDGVTQAEDGVQAFTPLAETPLVYIHAEADKAPGEGTDTKIGNFPNNMMQAAAFFQNGLYWNTVKVTVDADEAQLAIGIRKTTNDHRADNWVVTDNFRVKYLGASETTGIREVSETATQSGAIYNLKGQKVKHATNGIFIIDGKKVKK